LVKRTTIVDIAREAKVSVSTVSKALMDAPDISYKTKCLIRKTAEELGYVQNLNAASLKSGSSKMIGILCDSLLNPYYNEIIYYLEILLSEKNYTVVIYRSNELNMKIYNNMISRNLEGLVSFLTPDSEVERCLQNHSFPAVIIGRKSNYVSSVYMDDEKIGCLAAEYLLKQNVKKPIYIGEFKGLDISILRGKGFKDRMIKDNIEPILFFNERDQHIKVLLDSIKNDELLNCDSIFCFSDIIAFEVMNVLSKIGKKDIPIIGVDNIHAEIPLPFSMLSVGANKKNIAKKAIKFLLDQINGINNDVQVYVEEVYFSSF